MPTLFGARASRGLAPNPLVAGFENPPQSAKPQIWWDWMNGNVTRRGITADLEAMDRIGIGEANIITVASAIPAGPVPVMSRAFFDMIEHAAKVANRLGMTLCMDNCPGWSNSGGPWVTPEHAMQRVTYSEMVAHGPGRFSAKLPQPASVQGYYRDIAVLAFKTRGTENDDFDVYRPSRITANTPGVDPAELIARGAGKSIVFPVPTPREPVCIQVEYPHPITVRILTITSGAMRSVSGLVLGSADGAHFHVLTRFTIRHGGGTPKTISLGSEPVSSKVFRIQFNHAAPKSTGVVLKSVAFSARVVIEDIAAKAGFNPSEVDPREVAKGERLVVPPNLAIPHKAIINLTSTLKPDGSLDWNVPAGYWTILRFGYTPTGRTNHPAPVEATGLECDKLSPAGLDVCWSGMMQPVLDRLGPLAGKVLDDCLIDSYEVGGQNWTARMIEEFRRRRGYDPTPYLPVMTGRIVDSPEVSERFLWDLRRTIADLFAKNYYGHFSQLCHEHGLKSMVEPYTGPFESLQSGAATDIPMGEFWAGQKLHVSVKMASSIGHIYGQRVIAAESFTGQPDHGSWEDDPYSLKPLGDLAFCAGINRFVFHRFAHQPWLNRYPGMTMGKWGINLDRTNTWFEMAEPWMKYLARCQFLLQQGRSVADVAYFCGQSAPVVVRSGTPPLPKGFDYDDIDADVLENQARVVNHRIVLSTGASYAVLVLPESDPEMTPRLLKTICRLVRDGAIVVGSRPDHSPSLKDYPDCDREVHALATKLWGDCDGKIVTTHTYGRGRVIWGQSLDQVLAGIHLRPDFESSDGLSDGTINFVHRRLHGTDIYFVANHQTKALHVECAFRVQGMIPELWHPNSGMIVRAPDFREENGRTIVPLDFDPAGSVFVVFRTADPVSGDHRVVACRRLEQGRPVAVTGPWIVKFPPHWGAPATATFDRLISWPDYPYGGIKYFSGTATYIKDIEIPSELLGAGRRLALDLGEVKNLAEVRLNGIDLGILWKPPFRVDITSAAKPGINHLEVRVVNLWPNRLIGDEQLPADVKWEASGALVKWPKWLLQRKPSPTGRLTFTTWHHITKEMPLLPSGLLGPVLIQPSTWIVVRQPASPNWPSRERNYDPSRIKCAKDSMVPNER